MELVVQKFGGSSVGTPEKDYSRGRARRETRQNGCEAERGCVGDARRDRPVARTCERGIDRPDAREADQLWQRVSRLRLLFLRWRFARGGRLRDR